MDIGGGGVIVGGYADMAVNLETMRGQLDFTRMENWTSPVDVARGIGVQRGGSELGHDIVVFGDVFAENEGDEGKIAGACFGSQHEAIGGTLEHNDLTAGSGNAGK